MSTTAAPSRPATPVAPVGTTVHMLHRFGHPTEISLYHSYPAALAALAATVRTQWPDIAYRDDVPASPDGLNDAEVVLAFYGGNGGGGGPDTPTFGMSLASGFAITEEVVAGPEPSEIPLRLATLRVLDATAAAIPAVTYHLDADGLTVEVSTGPDGYPTVSITPKAYMAGIPITVRLEGSVDPGGLERTFRLS